MTSLYTFNTCECFAIFTCTPPVKDRDMSGGLNRIIFRSTNVPTSNAVCGCTSIFLSDELFHRLALCMFFLGWRLTSRFSLSFLARSSRVFHFRPSFLGYFSQSNDRYSASITSMVDLAVVRGEASDLEWFRTAWQGLAYLFSSLSRPQITLGEFVAILNNCLPQWVVWNGRTCLS